MPDPSSSPTIEPTIAALEGVIRERRAPSELRDDTATFLREHGVDGEDLDAMVEVGAERMLVYRQLVHNRMRNTIRDFIPRVAARLGRTRYNEDVDAFVELRAAHSPYLRDVPSEFVQWVLPRWAEDPAVPDYIADLARHELLDLDVRNDPRGGEAQTELPMALDRPLRFDGATRLCAYEHAVHRLPKAVDDRSEPDAEHTELLVYRDDKHKPRYLALTPFAAALLRELIVEAKAVQPALMAAAESLGEPLDDDKLVSAAQLFADLGERGVCLGAEPS